MFQQKPPNTPLMAVLVTDFKEKNRKSGIDKPISYKVKTITLKHGE